MTEIKSLARGLRILEILASADESVTVSELATALAVDKSSASRLVHTLARHGFAEQDEKTRRFQLGEQARRLGQPNGRHSQLREVGRRTLHNVVAETGENAHLAVRYGDVAIVIADVESTEALRVVSAEGKAEFLYCTAIGKGLLAFGDGPLPERRVPLTPNTITDAAALRTHLAAVRRQGYALDDEEKTIGIRCLAVPVYERSGPAIATLGISGPTVRLTDSRIPQLAATLQAEAAALTQRLS